MWLWFSKLGSPKWFYELSGKWLPWLIGPMALLLIVGIIWALLFVPPDYQQGNTIRIMYIHVPFASISLAFFPLMALAGTITLVWRMKLADIVAKTAAPLGAWFTALALASGSIWGSDIWGTWWIWDARLTTAFLLACLYAGYCLLRYSQLPQMHKAKVAAVVAVIGLLDLPIIHYSVSWWHTLHQGATLLQLDKPKMHTSMLYPLLLMIIAALMLVVTTICLRYSTLVRRRKP